MGADTTSTQLIFFIAATVVATAAAGVMSAIVTDLVEKAQQRSDAFGDELTSEIRIINDPSRVVTSPSTIFYVKNTGQETLDYRNATVLIDGSVVTATYALLGGETVFRTGAVAQYTYSSSLSSGDHRVKFSMENGVDDELRFRV